MMQACRGEATAVSRRAARDRDPAREGGATRRNFPTLSTHQTCRNLGQSSGVIDQSDLLIDQSRRFIDWSVLLIVQSRRLIDQSVLLIVQSRRLIDQSVLLIDRSDRLTC